MGNGSWQSGRPRSEDQSAPSGLQPVDGGRPLGDKRKTPAAKGDYPEAAGEFSIWD